MGKSLYTCHVWLLVGFLGASFFPVCSMYIFFLLPSGHSDTHFNLGKGQCQRSVGCKSPWTEMAKL